MVDTTQNSDSDEYINREEQRRIQHVQEMQFDRERFQDEIRQRRWDQLIRLLEIALISVVALIALKIGLDYLIQTQHIEFERQTRVSPTSPTQADASSMTVLLLQKLLESPPYGSAEGANKQPSKTIQLSAVFGLIDKFVAAGAVPLKEALNLKEELTKNAIEGGKEILVDTAKKLVDKLLAKSKEDEPPRPGEAQGDRSIHITQYCGAASTGATSTYRPPHRHKKSPCPKEKQEEKPTGECKAP